MPKLDQVRRWDRDLTQAEQQRLAFARALMHAPAWVIIDAVLETLETEALQRVSEIFMKELHRTGVIYIGRTAASEHLFGRTVRLIKGPDAHRLAAPQTAPADDTRTALVAVN